MGTHAHPWTGPPKSRFADSVRWDFGLFGETRIHRECPTHSMQVCRTPRTGGERFSVWPVRLLKLSIVGLRFFGEPVEGVPSDISDQLSLLLQRYQQRDGLRPGLRLAHPDDQGQLSPGTRGIADGMHTSLYFESLGYCTVIYHCTVSTYIVRTDRQCTYVRIS